MSISEAINIRPITKADINKHEQKQRTESRFVIRDGNLYYQDIDSDNKKPVSPIIICGELRITARTRNAKGGNHGRLLEFKDDDGKHKAIAIPCSELQSDGLDIRKLLSDMGLYICPNGRARSLLNEFILESNPKQTALCVSRTGWHNGTYILPNRIIGQSNGERLVYQPESGDYTSDIAQSGTLEEWQEIPKLCAGNSRLTFALCCSFAAPLLNLLNENGGGFNLFGSSSDGKSTALFVAASVFGNPENYHRKWNSTHVGLEYLAFSRNDGLLALDELGEGDGKNVGKAAYTLADGVGRSRGKSGGGMRNTPTWKVVILSTGETTLEQHITESGNKVRAGQQVRMVDIPADTQSGFKAFDLVHGFDLDKNGKQLPNDHAGALFADNLNDLAKRHYGTPLIPYLEYIADQYGQNSNDFHHQHKIYASSFIDSYLPDKSTPQVRRVAKRFALMGFAGELAIKSGVTTWNEGEATKAAQSCLKAWIERRGGIGSQEEKAALDQVKYFFERYSESRFVFLIEHYNHTPNDMAEHYNHKPNDMAGYKRKKEGMVQFLVTPQVFKNEICHGLDSKKVAAFCIDAGLLVPDSQGKTSRKETIEGNPKRVYVFNSSALGS